MKFLRAIGVVALVHGGCWGPSLLGCGGATALESYRTDSLACVTNATTKAQADACRSAVVTRYCGPNGALGDAGGCSLPSDAGAQ